METPSRLMVGGLSVIPGMSTQPRVLCIACRNEKALTAQRARRSVKGASRLRVAVVLFLGGGEKL